MCQNFKITSWHGYASCITGPLCGESASQEDSPHNGTVMQDFNVFFLASLRRLYVPELWLIFTGLALHYRDVTWVSCCLKLLATRLYVQQLIQANSKENIKAGIADSPDKGPIRQKAFPCHGIILSYHSTIGTCHIVKFWLWVGHSVQFDSHIDMCDISLVCSV